ncbi:MAG: DNA starvation/stationary phase protection protein [Clostridiales bacterium]|nr:DNA starvation/stationary phase protection protein [Clostridiales bacterium]MCF8022210.1 DNA starvation/stationary phase protection protein [Clostridiales bacterium]
MLDLGLESKAKTEETVNGLNLYLANLNVLYVKLHNFHWNVVGFNFFEMHEKLQELYEFVALELDRIAERILMLGYKPVASLEGALRLTTLKEAPSVDFSSVNVARAVIHDFTEVVKQIRKLAALAGENNDEYTIVLLGDAIGFYEKNIWMFRAYLTPVK